MNRDPCTLPAGTLIPVALYHSEVLPSMDFETYSEAGFVILPGKVRGAAADGKGGLPVVGTPVYAEHPSTEILSLVYDLKDGRGRRRWLPGTPNPDDLLAHIAGGGLVEAWNVTFEFWIWNMVAVRRLGWPALPIEQCRCAMAKSRRFSLPGALDNAAKVLGTPQKDPDGKRLLQKLSRPHTPTKKRPAHRWTPATAWADFLKLYDYNDGDVLAEDHASAKIPDLTPYELPVWLMDQTINARGVQVDVETLDAALDILGQTERRYTLELATITGGAVGSVSETAKFVDWINASGISIDNLQAETVSNKIKNIRRALALQAHAGAHPVDHMIADKYRSNPNTPAVLRALEIRDNLGAGNVKKLRTLRLQVSSDGRLRDQYSYCGADRTGRWSAGGVQLQNITAKGPPTCRCEACGRYFGEPTAYHEGRGCPRCGSFMWHALPKGEWPIEAVEDAISDVRERSLDLIERIWGPSIALLCGILRALFVARDGCKLVAVDFSAIEAVAAACLARCQWRIEVFSTHGKIYEASAAKATGIAFDEILAYRKEHGTHHPARKGVGKIRELAGGYGGWVNAWKAFGAEAYFDDDDAIKADVLKWRDESPEIVDMWGGQFRWCGPGKWDYRPELFGLEGAAISAILHPGKNFSYNDITYGVKDDILFCRLPSGRFLHYHRPRLTPAADKLNRGPAYSISFEGWNSNGAKGPVGWQRMETFGGRLFENVVQAVSYDIQAEALLRLERAGYPVVLHTHDEGVAEVADRPEYNVDAMASIMSERPAWAAWWPLRAAGWEHERYQKD